MEIFLLKMKPFLRLRMTDNRTLPNQVHFSSQNTYEKKHLLYTKDKEAGMSVSQKFLYPLTELSAS